jgi:large repetitive protein
VRQFPSRHLFVALLAACVCLLTACGGGGGTSGGQDLTVTLSYYGGSNGPALFLPVQITPTLGGLGGNTPRCSVTGGSLPPGLSVGQGCAITGNPTVVGSFSATITLTVDGFGGSVSAVAAIDVLAPTLLPVRTASAFSADQDLALGVAVNHMPIVTVGTLYAGVVPYAPASGDVATYSITSGALPAGLTFDPSNGTLTGAPAEPGVSTFSVGLTITHNGMAFTATSVPIRLAAAEAAFALSYGACCSSVVGDDITLLANSTFVSASGATVSFSMDGSLVPGLTINPSTGALTGNLTAAGNYNLTVIERVSFSDGSAVSAQTTIPWSIVGPSLTYSASPFSTYSGSTFSIDADPIASTLPGDVRSFSVMPTPGSGTTTPAWLSIDATTGRLFGVAGAPADFGPSLDLTVVLTTKRNGHDYQTSARLGLILH